MDAAGFAQSRGDDDLFDDELIPIAPDDIQVVTEQLQDTSIQQESPVEPVPREQASRETTQRGPRVRGGPNKIKGLLRGRGRGGGSTTQPSRASPSPPKTPVEASTESPAAETASDATTQATQPDQEQQPARPQAVRGDRLATGGVKKPKLTDEELTAKMAEAKARATTLSEAHARAQADAESFEERERIARERRKQTAAKDAANRQVMDHEREANRRRKMQAQGIREWDMEKNEEEFSGRDRRRGGYMRGAHGGIRYERKQESQPELEFDQTSAPIERGRGGRGRGRGRGRGGADRNGTNNDKSLSSSKYAQPDFSRESEFPALPPGVKAAVRPTKQSEGLNQNERKSSEILHGSSEGGTWADQVESSVTEK